MKSHQRRVFESLVYAGCKLDFGTGPGSGAYNTKEYYELQVGGKTSDLVSRTRDETLCTRARQPPSRRRVGSDLAARTAPQLIAACHKSRLHAQNTFCRRR